METTKILVEEADAGVRIDSFLAVKLAVSRAWATEIIASGGVSAGVKQLKKNDRTVLGQEIVVRWREKPTPKVVPKDVPELVILHEDDEVVVVDKPAGVAAHPSFGWDGPDVLGVLAARNIRLATSGPAERNGIVHRLDQGTSGVMVVAKGEYAYSSLKKQFHDREVEKIYHAVVQGYPDPPSGTIDGPIGRDPRHEWKFAVVAGGKPAITHYDTEEIFRYATLLRVHLETGRTHQIRVHMAAQHHPCVGDDMYGANPELSKRLGLDRQWLHASELEFLHPGTGARVRFQAPYAPELEQALDWLHTAENL